MTDVVLYAMDDEGIVTITINRPRQLNALSAEVRDGLRQAWRRFEIDPEAKVAILTGSGDRAFCAGMDLKEAATSGIAVPPYGFVPTLGDDTRVSKPTISAVNGLAMAGGWLLAQMCDLCLAAEEAVLAISEAKVGRGTPWAAPLIHMLPQRVCMEILMTGEPISARRLYELGYINRVVPRAELMNEAESMARKIAANAPLTVRACRELVYQSTEMGRSAALRVGHKLFEPVYSSADAQEGPRAFAERRAPKWRGA